jgi:hypothetical protein
MKITEHPYKTGTQRSFFILASHSFIFVMTYVVIFHILASADGCGGVEVAGWLMGDDVVVKGGEKPPSSCGVYLFTFFWPVPQLGFWHQLPH